MIGSLQVIATPIGNLNDTSKRALDALASVDVVLCEDTRVTKKLLSHYGIDVQTISYHQHSGQSKSSKIISLLEEGKNLALVSDAGTPAVSDPGGKLIEQLVSHFGGDIVISPIPGPSAVLSILSVSGFSADRYIFYGFAPHKKGRQAFFSKISEDEITVVFFESTHRIMKTMDALKEIAPDRQIVVGRELTKLHETIYRGVPHEVTEQLESTSIKGEFVIVLKGKNV